MNDAEKALGLASAIAIENDVTPLEAAMAELARHDVVVRNEILKQVKEQSEYMMASGVKKLEASRSELPPAQGVPHSVRPHEKPISNSKIALGLAIGVGLLCGVVAFCWAMIAGVPHHTASGTQSSGDWGFYVVGFTRLAFCTIRLVRVSDIAAR